MTWLDIYLYTRIDTVKDVFCIVLLLTGGFIFLHTVFNFFELDDYADDKLKKYKENIKPYRFVYISFFILLGINILLPSQKEVTAMIVFPRILNEQNVEKLVKISDDGIDLTKLAIEYLKETLPEKVSKNK